MTPNPEPSCPADLDFDLPEDRIALRPASERSGSRLLHLDPDGRVADRRFVELPELLRDGDLLVVNDVRVRAVKLRGRKESGAAVDLLLLPGFSGRDAEALLRCNGTLRPGEAVLVGERRLQLRDKLGGGRWRLVSDCDLMLLLDEQGSAPLPPYIARRRAPDAEDLDRYQTVYANDGSACAAPTAGLHFSPASLDTLERRGVERLALRLDVGPGTFRPLNEDLPFAEQSLHAETWSVPPRAAATLATAFDSGRRVIAVGTTVVRTLEAWRRAGRPEDGAVRETSIFLYPGNPPRLPFAALITNFHLPKSSLLALVCAYAGSSPVLRAYRHAVAEGYRFYSYGDACFLEAPGG